MNLNELRQLKDGEKVLARFATRDNADGSAPEWSEPKNVTLFVRKTETNYKKRPAGSIIELTVKDFSWATYNEENFCEEYNEFTSENYRMQILEIALQDEKIVVQ